MFATRRDATAYLAQVRTDVGRGVWIAPRSPANAVRTWRAAMLKAGKPGPTTVAKSYRLLRATLGTAVEDGLIPKNPCAITGAGVDHHDERPVATVE